MPNKFYSLPKSVFEHYHAKIKDWVKSILPTKTSDLDNDSDFLDQLALAGIIAVTFSASSTYKVGDYVLYNHTLYRCNTAITTAGAWDASKWDAAKTQDIFKGSAPGLVPAAESGDADKVLKGDGTWGVVSGGSGGSTARVSYDAQTEELHLDFSPPLIVNIGGRDYTYVKIGNQLWLAEDLMVTWNGLEQVTGWIESPSYIKNTSYPNTYYYNDLAITDLFNNHINLIPSGWRIPTKSDYQYLINNYSHLELKSVIGWNPEGTNESGLSLSPVGGYSSGGWDNSNGTDFFTATSGLYFRIEFSSPYVRFVDWSHNYHKYCPVRLVKDVT